MKEGSSVSQYRREIGVLTLIALGAIAAPAPAAAQVVQTGAATGVKVSGPVTGVAVKNDFLLFAHTTDNQGYILDWGFAGFQKFDATSGSACGVSIFGVRAQGQGADLRR